MLFRRFAQHLEDQNWFAVTLDLLIVVVGIYMGLQVDAWNESRQERVMEGQYLERLLDDMDSSLDTQLQIFELEKAGIDSMDELARDIADGTLNEADRDATVQALNYMGWVENPKTRLVSTYSGWFKFHRTLLQAHHRDTRALHDLVQAELETRFR